MKSDKEFQAILARTNQIWNDEDFNSLNTIGSMMGFLKEHEEEIKSLEDFKRLYYKSGDIRKRIISMNDLGEELNSPEEMRKMKSLSNPMIQELNYKYGRTKTYIKKLAADFAKLIGVTKETALELVEYRMFDETYRGELVEDEIVVYLNDKCEQEYVIEKAPVKFDALYAVDIVISDKEENIVAGVQVKPESYFRVNYHHDMNKNKNNAFLDKYGAQVYYAGYSKVFGTLADYVFMIPHELDYLLKFGREFK